jgi:hypothetical protein
MQRPFSISTPTESVRTDGSGHADVVFTVANLMNVPIAGMARLVPLGTTQREWLALAGSEEREFPAGAMHQFAVAVNVPATAPEGRYPFRLDLINTRKAAEDHAESPVVTIDVPARAAAVIRKAPSWIALAALALLVVLGTGAYLLFRPVEPLPAPTPVVDTAPVTADTDTTGTMSTTKPVVESNLVTVPNVISVAVNKAEWELESAGLKSTRKEVIDRAAQPGTVRMLSPKPGTQVEKGSNVELEVVIAADLIDVPNVIDVKLEVAQQLIEKVGLVAVVADNSLDYAREPNIVYAQTPKGGEQVARGTQVRLTTTHR